MCDLSPVPFSTDSSSFHAMLVQHCSSGMLVVDAQQPTLPIVYVNDGFERLTGYSAAEVVGKNPRFLQGDDHDQDGLKTIRAALEKQESAVAVLRNYRKDGTMFWNELRISPVRDASSRLTHYVGIQNDVSVRMKFQKVLARREASYRRFFKNESAVMLLVDPRNGRIVDTNETAATFYGYTVEQLRSMYVRDLSTLTPTALQQIMQFVVEKGHTVIGTQHRMASGEIRDVDVYTSALDMREGRFLYAIIMDATEKRMAERRYQALFDNNSDAVLMRNLNNQYMMVNRAAENMLGYSAEEFCRLTFTDLVAPEDSVKAEIINQRLLAGEPIPRYERILRRKEGSRIIVEINSCLIRTPDGKPLHVQSIVRDITQRKRMEESLRRNEDQLRTIVENVPLMIGFYDALGAAQYCNPYWEKRLGMSKDALNAHFDLPDLVSRNGDETAQQQTLSLMLSSESGWHDFEIVTPKGETLTLSWTNVHLTDGRSISLGNDITERKQAEQRLWWSQVQLARAQRIAQLGDWDYDVPTQTLSWSDETFRLFGLRTREVQPTIEFFINAIHPEDRQAARQILNDSLYHKAPCTFDHRVVWPDGQIRYLHQQGEVVLDDNGQPIRLIGTCLDITGHVLMQESLRQSEEKYRMIAENTSDGIIIIDGKTGKLIYASPSYDLQHGREVGESLQMDATTGWDTIHPEDRERVTGMIREAITHHQNNLVCSYRMLHKDGHYFWREDHARYHYAPDGSYLSAYVVSRDITERKQAEQRQMELRLEKERTGMLTDFIRDAAHEFRTPLAAIGAASYLMARYDDPERRQHKAEVIESQIKRVARLIDSLMMMVQAERTDILQRPVEVASILQYVSSLYANKLPIYLELQPNMPTLIGDQDLLTGALQQLVDNAVRFSPPDGVVNLYATAVDGQMTIEIVDKGTGIAPEDMPRIYNTFWRRDDAHTTSGFGLGLPIARRIIEQHNGSLTIESRVGEGTRVRVTLPTKTPSPSSPSPNR